MDIKILDQQFDKIKYNKMAIHPLQSWEWGDARKAMGIEVLRLTDGSNVFQITFHNIPHTNYKIGYLPRSVPPHKNLQKFLRNEKSKSFPIESPQAFRGFQKGRRRLRRQHETVFHRQD